MVLWSLGNGITYGCNCDMEIIRKGNFYAVLSFKAIVNFGVASSLFPMCNLRS